MRLLERIVRRLKLELSIGWRRRMKLGGEVEAV